MYARRVGDVADHLVRIDIDHNDVGSMRYIQAARRAVDGKVIPPPVAPHFNLSNDVVVRSGQGGRRSQKESTCKSAHNHQHETPI